MNARKLAAFGGGAPVHWANDRLQEHITHLASAIDLCLEHRFVLPGLVLLYVTVDIIAWLDRERGHRDVQSSDFVRWCDRYLLPGSGLRCTAQDLYAARCALVHSSSAESRMSRRQAAREIWYAWGSHRQEELQHLIDRLRRANAVAVQVEELFGSLKTAITRFLSDLGKNATRRDLVAKRAKKFFAPMQIPGSR